MEAMSRERKLYQSLELDEGEAHGKYRRDVRVPPRKLAQPCESLLCILPNIPYFSGRQSLQLAYDDLEERFFELEIRFAENSYLLSESPRSSIFIFLLDFSRDYDVSNILT